MNDHEKKDLHDQDDLNTEQEHAPDNSLHPHDVNEAHAFIPDNVTSEEYQSPTSENSENSVSKSISPAPVSAEEEDVREVKAFPDDLEQMLGVETEDGEQITLKLENESKEEIEENSHFMFLPAEDDAEVEYSVDFSPDEPDLTPVSEPLPEPEPLQEPEPSTLDDHFMSNGSESDDEREEAIFYDENDDQDFYISEKLADDLPQASMFNGNETHHFESSDDGEGYDLSASSHVTETHYSNNEIHHAEQFSDNFSQEAQHAPAPPLSDAFEKNYSTEPEHDDQDVVEQSFHTEHEQQHRELGDEFVTHDVTETTHAYLGEDNSNYQSDSTLVESTPDAFNHSENHHDVEPSALYYEHDQTDLYASAPMSDEVTNESLVQGPTTVPVSDEQPLSDDTFRTDDSEFYRDEDEDEDEDEDDDVDDEENALFDEVRDDDDSDFLTDHELEEDDYRYLDLEHEGDEEFYESLEVREHNVEEDPYSEVVLGAHDYAESGSEEAGADEYGSAEHTYVTHAPEIPYEDYQEELSILQSGQVQTDQVISQYSSGSAFYDQNQSQSHYGYSGQDFVANKIEEYEAAFAQTDRGINDTELKAYAAVPQFLFTGNEIPHFTHQSPDEINRMQKQLVSHLMDTIVYSASFETRLLCLFLLNVQKLSASGECDESEKGFIDIKMTSDDINHFVEEKFQIDEELTPLEYAKLVSNIEMIEYFTGIPFPLTNHVSMLLKHFENKHAIHYFRLSDIL